MTQTHIPRLRITAGRSTRRAAPATLLLALAVACAPAEQLVDHLRQSTPHERYADRLHAAGLDSTALGRDWLAIAESSLRQAVPVELPFQEAGYFGADEARAVAYLVRLTEGQQLVAQVTGEASTPFTLFTDLYLVPDDSDDELERVGGTDSLGTIERVARRDGAYILRLQPELLRGGRYTITLRIQPSLAFPVADRGNQAIRSFFGADRDGGSRSHHGIDIFAPRGTPVVAATGGIVRSVRNSRLGGKVVWLYDAEANQSLYYAHLDTQLVTMGTLVRTGDTLGLVGNTGNARSTPPHLHFGIYRRGRGPVDPLPFVRLRNESVTEVSASLDGLGEWMRTRVASNFLPAPGAPDSLRRRLPVGTAALVLGATAASYRVALPDGTEGYVTARSLEPATEPLRQARVLAATMVRDRPAASAPVITTVSEGSLPVLGSFDDFTLVRTASGRTGWAALE